MQQKKIIPFILVFVFTNLIVLLLWSVKFNFAIDPWLVAGANSLLFFISMFNVYQQSKSKTNQNPHAMVRSVMTTTVLKLFILGTAAFIYLYVSGENKNINGLFFSMALYIVYTWLDVRIALKENSES